MCEPPPLPELQGSDGEGLPVAFDQARFSLEVADAVNALLKVTVRKTLHQEHGVLLRHIKELFREELRNMAAQQLSIPPTQAKPGLAPSEGPNGTLMPPGRRPSLAPSEGTASACSAASRSLESVPSGGRPLAIDVKTLQMRVDAKILGASSLMMSGRAGHHDEHGGQHDSGAANAARSSKRAGSGGFKHFDPRALAAKSPLAKDEPSPPKAHKLKSVMPAPEDDKAKPSDIPPNVLGDAVAVLGAPAAQDSTQMEDSKARQIEHRSPSKNGVSCENTDMSRPKTQCGASVRSDDSRTSADFVGAAGSTGTTDFTRQASHGQNSEQMRYFGRLQSSRPLSEYANGYGDSEAAMNTSTSPVVSPSHSIGVEEMIRIRSSELTDRFQALGSCTSSSKLHPQHSSTHTLEAIEEARRVSGVKLDDASSACNDDAAPAFSMPIVLTVCGILPGTLSEGASRFYCWFLLYCWLVALLAILSCSALVYQAIHQPEFCEKRPNLSDLPLAVGGMLCLFSLTFWRQASEIQKSYLLLHIYAERHNLLTKIRRPIGWDSAVMVVLWVLVVLSQMRTGGFFCAFSNGSIDTWEVLPVIAHTVCTGLLLGACFCILNVSRGMAAMIDHFCLQAMQVDQLEILTCVGSWNVLQAVIRRVSGALERCFFLVQAVAALIVLLSVVDFLKQEGTTAHDLIRLIPSILVMCYILRIFFAAVQVTDKSLRVAPLITSLTDGDFVDEQRQFVVQHIVSSAAGFYVFDVCLTTSMAFKFTYFCIVVFLGLLARVVSSNTY